jgi:hypothetical protein
MTPAAPISTGTGTIRLKESKSLFGVRLNLIEQLVKIIVFQLDPDGTKPDTDDAIIAELVRIAKDNADLWHDEFKEGYATTKRDGHTANFNIMKQDFQFWLIDKYQEEWSEYPRHTCIKPSLFYIGNHARKGEERDPKVRVTEYEGDIWIDLGDREWSAVCVSAEGWRVEPVMRAPLVRGGGMLSLPIPEGGGNIRDLCQFVNLRDSEAEVLFCGMAATNLNPLGAYQTTILCGPAGSGKTTGTRIIRAVTDPNKVDTRRYSTCRDLNHGAPNTHIIGLENVSEISDELSDTICAFNTGTGLEERKYYNQGIQWQVTTRNPVLINGIPANLAERSDLIDRTVTLQFDYLGNKVRSEDVFWRKFNAAAPRLFGALLDGLVNFMKVRDQYGGDLDEAIEKVLEGYRPRFAETVLCAELACRSWGFEPGEFTAAYRGNQDVAMRYLAEHDPICIGIKGLVLQLWDGTPGEVWRGIPSELSKAIRAHLKLVEVPSAEAIGKQLPRSIQPLERVYGIEIVMNKRLEQNDNRNGIIIGVGRGRFPERKLSSPDRTQFRSNTSITGFRRRRQEWVRHPTPTYP